MFPDLFSSNRYTGSHCAITFYRSCVSMSRDRDTKYHAMWTNCDSSFDAQIELFSSATISNMFDIVALGYKNFKVIAVNFRKTWFVWLFILRFLLLIISSFWFYAEHFYDKVFWKQDKLISTLFLMFVRPVYITSSWTNQISLFQYASKRRDQNQIEQQLVTEELAKRRAEKEEV